MSAESLGAATHAYCEQCDKTVPIAFGGFNLIDGPDQDLAGGDIQCSQCGFVIATVSRPVVAATEVTPD